MAKPAVAPLRRREFPAYGPDHTADPVHHHLGDAVPSPDDEGLLAVIDQDDPHLSPVVRVDRTGGVDQRYAVANG